MRRRPSLVLAVLLAASGAAAESGRTSAGTLTRTFSAAPAALGGAHGAVVGRLDGAFYNPAAMAGLRSPEFQATYLSGLENDSLGGVRYGRSFGGLGAFVGADYFDAGRIDVNLSDGTREERRAQQDTVGVLGLAIGRRSPVSLGAAVKVFRLELAEEASASGVAFDAGAIWKTPLEGLALGVSGTNAGADIKFEEESDPLPVSGRAALSYTLEFSRVRWLRALPYALEILVDGVAERDEDASVHAGLEIRRNMAEVMERTGSVALRIGYQDIPEAFTAGLGVRMGNIGLDYAFTTVHDVDPTHRATLSWRFLNRGERVASGQAPVPYHIRK